MDGELFIGNDPCSSIPPVVMSRVSVPPLPRPPLPLPLKCLGLMYLPLTPPPLKPLPLPPLVGVGLLHCNKAKST